ncbi:MAG: YggS family pyridoxal phosphate-dependent enzyme [Eggerthellaceae bacterium]|jgi:pyridoxal phosphate enzyme (YggS family)
MSIATRYRAVRAEIDEVCRSCGRDPREVKLVAVSKTVGIPEVAEAIEAGADVFGENRPDQIVPKQAAYPACEWHFIGNIQSRRIDDIVGAATMIHSVYQQHHLARIERAAVAHGKVQPILLEVNVSGEESKSGLAPDQVEEMMAAVDGFDHIRLCGLMTMAPRGDQNVAEETFAGLEELRNKLRTCTFERHGHFELNELSMGMSEDWRVAIPHGATMVRVGRAIFSDEFEPTA